MHKSRVVPSFSLRLGLRLTLLAITEPDTCDGAQKQNQLQASGMQNTHVSTQCGYTYSSAGTVYSTYSTHSWGRTPPTCYSNLDPYTYSTLCSDACEWHG